MKKRCSKLICLVFMIIAVFCAPFSVYAGTTITGYNEIPGSNQQVRYLKSVETKWTGSKYVSGQASKGYYLKKGDMLYYSESGGSTSSVSISVGYGCASVSVAIPMGKKASTGVGIALKAPKNGWYKIKANKQVKATIKTTQVRNVKLNGSGKLVPVDGNKGKWRYAMTTSKKYQTIRVKPQLVRIN